MKDDLKALSMKAAMDQIGTMLLFTESQIKNDKFMVQLNNILSSGDMSDLYQAEDVDTIIAAMLPRVKAAGIESTRSNAWDFFIAEVKEFLHLSLCFSPQKSGLREYAIRFPALVNCTVIDWFHPWPANALHKLGVKYLASIDLGLNEDVRLGIENFIPFLHTRYSPLFSYSLSLLLPLASYLSIYCIPLPSLISSLPTLSLTLLPSRTLFSLSLSLSLSL